jgi:hypothetical protein
VTSNQQTGRITYRNRGWSLSPQGQQFAKLAMRTLLTPLMRKGAAMTSYAALDISPETTAICMVDERGDIMSEKTVATCPEAIAAQLSTSAPGLVRVGMETGPLAVRRGP